MSDPLRPELQEVVGCQPCAEPSPQPLFIEEILLSQFLRGFPG